MKITLKSIYIFVFLLLPALTHAAANTYYVNQNGNGARNGESMGNAWSVSDFNSSANWSTIDHPNRIDPGDTVYFSGTITSTIRPRGSGSSGNYITLDGYEAGNCNPINSECTSSAEIVISDRAFEFTTQDYVTIQDFRSEGGKFSFPGTSTANDSSHIIIRRNEIHDIDGNGIDIDWGDYFTIGGALGDGNEIRDIGVDTSDGDISINHTVDIVISYNHLYATKSNGNSGDRGIDGIVSNGSTGNVLIEYNSIHNHNDRYGGDAQGEDGIDVKQGGNNFIIRFNKIYSHYAQSGITFQGGVHDNYVYGNFIADNVGGIWVMQKSRSRYGEMGDIHIWSNVITGNLKGGIGISDKGAGVNNVYLYNNTLSYSGVDHLRLDGWHYVGSDYLNLGASGGLVRYKNNIFYYSRPNESDYLQCDYGSSGTVATLEHNTYFWPGQQGNSVVDYSGGNRTIAVLKSAYSREDDSIAGEDANPGFTDPNGSDNTYGTVDDDSNAGKDSDPGFTDPNGADNVFGTMDDDYTLDGTNINDGVDLSQCFDVSIQGTNYHICYNDALDPAATDWKTTPPIVRTIKQGDQGSWERGAYVYKERLEKPVSATAPAPPDPIWVVK